MGTLSVDREQEMEGGTPQRPRAVLVGCGAMSRAWLEAAGIYRDGEVALLAAGDRQKLLRGFESALPVRV